MQLKGFESWENNLILSREQFLADKKLWGEYSKAIISGVFTEDLEYNRTVAGVEFYKTTLKSVENENKIKVLVPHSIMDGIGETQVKDSMVQVEGQFRVFYQVGKDAKKHYYFYMVASNIVYNKPEIKSDINLAYLNGYIATASFYYDKIKKENNLSFIIAVDIDYDEMDHIPCVVYKADDSYERYKVGDMVELYGRIERRKYTKYLDTGKKIKKTTYNVVVDQMRAFYD